MVVAVRAVLVHNGSEQVHLVVVDDRRLLLSVGDKRQVFSFEPIEFATEHAE